MRRRQLGISLLELSFVAGISVILSGIVAGAGSYLSNRSHASALVEDVKRFDKALQEYIAKANNAGKPWLTPGNANPISSGVLTPFLAPQGETFRNPYDATNYPVIAYSAAAAGQYPNANSYDSSVYPMNGQGGRPDYRGRILYFYNDYDAYHRQTFNVADSGNYLQIVYQYALQALDDQGWPVITVSH